MKVARNHLDLLFHNLFKMPRVFFITGTSTGFGAHLVQTVIDAGDVAVATARNPSQLSFKNTSEKNYLAVKLDVTKHHDIESAFKTTLDKFGRVDVVVNNAGYGLSGPFEELDEKHIRQQMEVNFFGLINVTKKAMEVMRDQKPSGGLIQQVRRPCQPRENMSSNRDVGDLNRRSTRSSFVQHILRFEMGG